MTKQLSIVQVKVHLLYSTSSKKVVGENFFQNMAQLGNFLYGATFFILKCGMVAQCHGGANFAVKTLQWCGGVRRSDTN